MDLIEFAILYFMASVRVLGGLRMAPVITSSTKSLQRNALWDMPSKSICSGEGGRRLTQTCLYIIYWSTICLASGPFCIPNKGLISHRHTHNPHSIYTMIRNTLYLHFTPNFTTRRTFRTSAYFKTPRKVIATNVLPLTTAANRHHWGITGWPDRHHRWETGPALHIYPILLMLKLFLISVICLNRLSI